MNIALGFVLGLALYLVWVVRRLRREMRCAITLLEEYGGLVEAIVEATDDDDPSKEEIVRVVNMIWLDARLEFPEVLGEHKGGTAQRITAVMDDTRDEADRLAD